jgi:hypothetical protein
VDAGKSDSSTEPTVKDASMPIAGEAAPPPKPPVEFMVPKEGGSVMVEGRNGMPVAFEFPPEASGMMITLTPTMAASIGFPESQFSEVIKLEPDGATFAEPIVVVPPSGDVIVMTFPSSENGEKTKPEPLDLAPDGSGFLLNHFSTLVVVAPEKSCGDSGGWKVSSAEASAEFCSDPDYPIYIELDCHAYAYCAEIEAHCCAKERSTSCHLGDRNLFIEYSLSSDTHGGDYPYCGGTPSGTGGKGGMSEPEGGTGGTAGPPVEEGGSGGSNEPPVDEAGAGAGGAGAGGAGAGGAGEGGAGEGGAGAGGAGAGGAGAGGGGSGGSGGDESIVCGLAICDKSEAWDYYDEDAEPCCATENTCGVRSQEVCIPVAPTGLVDEGCPTIETSFLKVDGCCTPHGQCGGDYYFNEMGCVPRSQVTDLLGGPLESLDCNATGAPGGDEDGGVSGFCQPYTERQCFCGPGEHGSQQCKNDASGYMRCSCDAANNQGGSGGHGGSGGKGGSGGYGGYGGYGGAGYGGYGGYGDDDDGGIHPGGGGKGGIGGGGYGGYGDDDGGFPEGGKGGIGGGGIGGGGGKGGIGGGGGRGGIGGGGGKGGIGGGGGFGGYGDDDGGIPEGGGGGKGGSGGKGGNDAGPPEDDGGQPQDDAGSIFPV